MTDKLGNKLSLGDEVFYTSKSMCEEIKVGTVLAFEVKTYYNGDSEEVAIIKGETRVLTHPRYSWGLIKKGLKDA